MKGFSEYQAYVFDLDGTLNVGDVLLPGARELTEALLSCGKRVCYFTNNTSRGNDAYVARLRGLGLPCPEEIFTPGTVAKDWLRAHVNGGSVYVFGSESFRAWMGKDVKLAREDADAVLLALHTEVTWADLVTLCNLLQRGKPFCVTHPDPACPGVPLPVPDAGAFLALATTCTGRQPDVICGKPTVAAGRSLAAYLGMAAGEIMMVGDRYSTDILLGKNNGFGTAQVATGAQEDLTGKARADFEAESVRDLLRLL